MQTADALHRTPYIRVEEPKEHEGSADDMSRRRPSDEYEIDSYRREMLEGQRITNERLERLLVRGDRKAPYITAIVTLSIFLISSLVGSVMFILSLQAEARHLLDLREADSKTIERLEREITVNKKFEDERYRQLEIRLVAKKIIPPG